MDESEQKVKIRKKNFPWSSGLTNFLLNFYGKLKFPYVDFFHIYYLQQYP